MKSLNKKLLHDFLALAGNSLKGNWILLGGTVLPALGIDHRVTTDIDFVGLSSSELRQQIQVMEIAEKLGLSIETINQAAGYFLKKIKHKQDDLVVLHKGSRATIYRPGTTLYLLLKIPRFSESDLADCIEMLKFAQKKQESVDIALIERAIQKEIKKELSKEKLNRLLTLKKAIQT
ncbi:MAG: hypothetical protein AB7F43_14085 [Bacteriovoracia bacterium]